MSRCGRRRLPGGGAGAAGAGASLRGIALVVAGVLLIVERDAVVALAFTVLAST